MKKFLTGAVMLWSFMVQANSEFVVPWAGVLPFELQWMNHETKGTTFKSTDHPSGIFVVEAYFLNCPYCNDNAPLVNDLAEKYANEPRVHVLDVGVDKSDMQYATWISKHKPNHPVLKDASKKLISLLGTSGYPSTYVIDCRGNVTFKSAGAWSSSKKQTIQNAIDALLKEECFL